MPMRADLNPHGEAHSESNPAQPMTVKVTEAVLTYVAINQHGQKRELPKLA